MLLALREKTLNNSNKCRLIKAAYVYDRVIGSSTCPLADVSVDEYNSAALKSLWSRLPLAETAGKLWCPLRSTITCLLLRPTAETKNLTS